MERFGLKCRDDRKGLKPSNLGKHRRDERLISEEYWATLWLEEKEESFPLQPPSRLLPVVIFLQTEPIEGPIQLGRKTSVFFFCSVFKLSSVSGVVIWQIETWWETKTDGKNQGDEQNSTQINPKSLTQNILFYLIFFLHNLATHGN